MVELRLQRFGEPVALERVLGGKSVTWLGHGAGRPLCLVDGSRALPLFEARVPPVRISQRGSRARSERHLVLHLAGHGCYRAAGVTVEQRPGDVVVVDAAAAVEVDHPAGAHVVALALPASPATTTALPVRRLPGAAGRLVARELDALAEEAPGLGPGLRAGLVHHVAGLVDLALVDAELEAGDPLALRRQEVIGWLEAHLAAPDLSAEGAARALGISRRWLHEVLKASNTSFRDYVTRRRLEICRARLEDPALAHQSITTIALASGFNDLSTFYRQFRRRYRTTPRAVREAAPSERQSALAQSLEKAQPS